MCNKLLFGLLVSALCCSHGWAVLPAVLVGKWHCQIYHQDKDIHHQLSLHFFRNGQVQERTQIEYGQPQTYEYQVEKAVASATWHIEQEVLVYDNYRVRNYAVKIPNVKDDDVVQASIALQKSLPIIDTMMKKEDKKRLFEMNLLHKKSILLHDIEQQTFLDCRKKSLLKFD